MKGGGVVVVFVEFGFFNLDRFSVEGEYGSWERGSDDFVGESLERVTSESLCDTGGLKSCMVVVWNLGMESECVDSEVVVVIIGGVCVWMVVGVIGVSICV